MIQRLCYLFLCATKWQLNSRAGLDATLLAGRTVHLLVRMHRILEGRQVAQNSDVLALSGKDIVRETRLSGQWTVTETSLDKFRPVRLELRMVVDAMELMQYTDDYVYGACELFCRDMY